MRKTVDVIDPKTGKVIRGAFVWIGERIPSPWSGKFMVSNQEFLEQLVKRPDIGFELLRVFVFLNARLDFNNLVQLPQTEIARALGMKKQNVHRTMKRLEELGIIIRGPKVGHSCSYRLNPQAGWKGKAKDHRTALKELMDARGMRVVD